MAEMDGVLAQAGCWISPKARWRSHRSGPQPGPPPKGGRCPFFPQGGPVVSVVTPIWGGGGFLPIIYTLGCDTPLPGVGLPTPFAGSLGGGPGTLLDETPASLL